MNRKIEKTIKQTEVLPYIQLIENKNNKYIFRVNKGQYSKKITVIFPSNYPIECPIIIGINIVWNQGMSLCQILHYVWETLDEDE